MRKIFLLLFSMVLISGSAKVKKKVVVETWPDNTLMDAWFKDTTKVDVATLGRQYVITDYGVKNDSNIVQTSAIQAVIDRAAQEGGGVVVIPEGTFLTGGLFFKQGTHLHVIGRLKGSERIMEPSTAMASTTGRSSGFVGSGIPSVPTRMPSVRD